MVNVRPIRLTRFHTTTSQGYWEPLSETTAQEFHPVAQCDQWPLLFHAVQQHILFQPTSNPLQLLFIHMVNVRPIRLTRFHTTTSPGYWEPLSETTAQEFHPVAQCDQWPLLFHAVQQHILIETHIKPSATFSETTAQEFHLVAQCDQWPLLFHAVQQHILFQPTSNPLQLLFIHMVNVRPIRLTRFHTTTSPGYWGPLSETTAQEFHPVAQCDQWPLLFHAVQQHILFQTHIKPSTTFVHSHGQCATHQINEIPYNNVTRVLRTPQWNHSTRVSSRRTVWSMTPVVPCSATAYPLPNPHQTLYNFCSFTWSMCDPSD